MSLRLHASATTTPKIGIYIQASILSERALAAELDVTVGTARRGRSRDTQHDASRAPHRLPSIAPPAEYVLFQPCSSGADAIIRGPTVRPQEKQCRTFE